MRRFALLVGVLALAAVPAASGGGGPATGKQPYKPHLVTLGSDSLGPASTGFNSEIVVDAARDFAYVGSVDFSPFIGGPPDVAVKAVDVSDPTNPTMTDAQDVLGGDLGPFDVKIAGNVLAASTQGAPESNPGITLMDITDPADPVPVSHLGNIELSSPFGSHNSFLWRDPLTGQIWLFATGLDLTSLKIYDVSNPALPLFVAEYDNGCCPGDELGAFVHDNFVQEGAGGRVFEYQAGVKGVEILDVTRIVRGGEAGPITDADVVAFNYYTSGLPGAPPVTRPGFAHYIQPTASGRVTWVGDEAGCGQPGIIRAFETSVLPPPLPGAKLPLVELGTIVENPDAPMCSALIRTGNERAQTNEFRWTGHNFDIAGDSLLIRGDYGRGVYVYDISDPANAGWVAKSRGLNQLVGEENRADPGRMKFLESYPFFWQAVYDGDLIYASNINQGIFVLDLVGD